jgi:magnesium chelatase family protein
MDRIDLQVEIMPVPFEKLANTAPGESSAAIRERVVKARVVQSLRYRDTHGVHCNAQMTPRLLDEYAHLTPDCMRVLETAIKRFDMSARAYDRIRKVARTIADLDYANSPSSTAEAAVSAPILVHHISEAISYRNLDRSTWGSDTGLPITLR